MRWVFVASYAVLGLLVGACSGVGSAAVEAARQGFFNSPRQSYQRTPLDPRYVYLEVDSPQASALMVLAYHDQPDVETWISASKEVIRTHRGFVVFSEGVPRLWDSLQVRLNAEGQPESWLLNFKRRDVYNVPVRLLPQSVDSKSHGLPTSAMGKRAAAMPNLRVQRWVTEVDAEQPRLSSLNGLEQIVAVDTETGQVMYGKQCVEQNYCIEFLRRSFVHNF
jgi:hypothetical protein